MNKMTPAQMAKLLNRHFLADHENLAHLLPSAPINQVDDHRKKEEPHTRQPYNKQGKLEPTTYAS